MIYPGMTKEKYIQEYNTPQINDSTVVPCLCGDPFCSGWRYIPEELKSIIEKQPPQKE
jgi:hypothetical protein